MSNLFANLLDDDSDGVIFESEVIVQPKRLKLDEKVGTSHACDHPKLKNEVGVKAETEQSTSANAVNDDLVENKLAEPANGALSKRAIKRLKKHEDRLKNQKEKRKRERERRKERRRADPSLRQPKPEYHKMIDSKCKVRVAIDLAFEKMMNEEGIRKTLSQLNFCYAANRKAANPMQFYIVNLRDKTKTMFEGRAGNSHWDLFVMEETLEELWSPSDIVYLTADSENVLERLEESKTYVIGGLVDHNAHKGLCHNLAVSKGFSHARLPIDNFIKMKTRKVLTINHVFEILVHFSASRNWEEAFFAAIPQRKGAERLEKGGGGDKQVPSVDENSFETIGEENAQVVPSDDAVIL